MTPKEFFTAVKEYIEEMEARVEGEWGSARSIQELIRVRDMPKLYWETLAILEHV